MNRHTGRRISTDDHIRQSVGDILTTPIGSRIMRRTYGSVIPDLIDQPFNDATRLRLIAATHIALARWEPRVTVASATPSIDLDGKGVIDIEAIRTTGPAAGQRLAMSIPL